VSRSFKPSNYNLVIDGITFAPNWTYEGLLTITGSLVAANEIVLNAHQLKLHSAELRIDGRSHSANVQYQEEQQRVKLLFEDILCSCQDAELIVRFQGLINDAMAGFSRSKYRPVAPTAHSVSQNVDGEDNYMLFTQFQPCDARRAFPCFDEPALKASFELSIEIPDDQIALSNTAVETTIESSRSRSSPDWKWKFVQFEKSPVMSTYLFTWAVGDLAYAEAHTMRVYGKQSLPVRLYTTKGLEEQGSFALAYAWRIIDLLSGVSTTQ
jgi:aminopeptidase N